jgi:hypothetical protein
MSDYLVPDPHAVLPGGVGGELGRARNVEAILTGFYVVSNLAYTAFAIELWPRRPTKARARMLGGKIMHQSNIYAAGFLVTDQGRYPAITSSTTGGFTGAAALCPEITVQSVSGGSVILRGLARGALSSIYFGSVIFVHDIVGLEVGPGQALCAWVSTGATAPAVGPHAMLSAVLEVTPW